MRQVPSREELEGVLRALLVTRKEAITVGIPLSQLDNDYKINEGTRIPYRELGFCTLLDCLQTLTGGVIVSYRHGMHYAFPVVDEKTKHVSDMVVGQNDNSKKNYRGGRRSQRSSSAWYPRVVPPPVRVDCRILAEIMTLVKASPAGISFDYVLNYVRRKMNYNIGANDLSRQLGEISHEITLNREFLYPVTKHSRHSQSLNKSTAAAPTRATGNYDGNLRAGGASSSDSDENDDFASSLANTVRNDEPTSGETNVSCCETGRTRNEFHEKSTDEDRRAEEMLKNASAMENSSGHESNENFVKEETIADLITQKTKIRLEMLIRKYPEGIWCAELPQLYKKEYTIPLNYEEVGFGSVSDFASHLPEIFHCIQPQEKGDFKLFSAKAEKPDVKQTKRPVLTTAAFHNIYEKYEIEAIPAVLSKETAARLIPDGVMVPGETVAQICVTELDHGINQYIDVVVVDVFTPSFFWIHLLKKIPNFRRFMDDLHEFYEKASSKYLMPTAVMERGLNCACIYDGKWHRAIIKTVRPDNLVTLLFYDYGTVGSYSLDQIYFLHRTFSSLPAQAIPCGLWNVKPPGSPKWTRIITTEFSQKVSNIPLVATIAHIDTDNNSMMVGLTNTEGDEDFHINDWMVEIGYATYGKMVCIGPRNYPFRRFLQCNSLSFFNKSKDSTACDLKKVDKLGRDTVVKIKSRRLLSNDIYNGYYNNLINLRRKSGENSSKLLITEKSSIAVKTRDDSHFLNESKLQTSIDRRDNDGGTNDFATYDLKTRHDATASSRVNKSRKKFLRELCEAYRRKQSSSSTSNSNSNLDERRDKTYDIVPSISQSSSSVDLRKNEFVRNEEETSNERIRTVPLHLKLPKSDETIDEFGTLHSRLGGNGRMDPIDWSDIHETIKSDEKMSEITIRLNRESTIANQPGKAEPSKLPETTKSLWDIDDDNETSVNGKTQDENPIAQVKIVHMTPNSFNEIGQLPSEDLPMLPESSSSPKFPKGKRHLWNVVQSQRVKKASVVDNIDDCDNDKVCPRVPKKEEKSSNKTVESSTIKAGSSTISSTREKSISEFGKFHSILGGNGRMEPVTWSELREIMNSPEKTYGVATQTISQGVKSRKSTILWNVPKANKTFSKMIGNCVPREWTNRYSMCLPEGNIRMGREITPLLRTQKNGLEKQRNGRVRVFIPNEMLEMMKDDGKGKDLMDCNDSSHTNGGEFEEKNCTKSIVHETKISSEFLHEVCKSSNSPREPSNPNDQKDSSESIQLMDKGTREEEKLNDNSRKSVDEILKISLKNKPSITEINSSLSPEAKDLSLSPKNTSSIDKDTNAWLQSVYLRATSKQLSKLIDARLVSTNDSELDSDDYSFGEEVKLDEEKNHIDDNIMPSPTKSSGREVSKKAEDRTEHESTKIHDFVELLQKKDIDSSAKDLDIPTNIDGDPRVSENVDDPDSIDNEKSSNLPQFVNPEIVEPLVINTDEIAIQFARNHSITSRIVNDLDLNSEDGDDEWDFSPGWFGMSTAEMIENVAKADGSSVSAERPSSMIRSRLATISSSDDSSLEMSDNCEGSTTVSGSSREETDTDTQPTDNKYNLIDDVSSDMNQSRRPSTENSPLIKHDLTTDNSEPRDSPCPDNSFIDNTQRHDNDEKSPLHDEIFNCKPNAIGLSADKPIASILTGKRYSIISEIKKSKIFNVSNDAFIHLEDSSSVHHIPIIFYFLFKKKHTNLKNLPVVCTNVKEAINQRSVIDAPLEDHKVRYLHSHNTPDRDNNVETVDMNDQPVETFYNEAFTRRPPGLSLSTIPEEIENVMTNSTLANGIGMSEEITTILNAHVMLAAKFAKIEINKCVNFGISYDSYKPAVQKELEELFQSLLNIGLTVQLTAEASTNLHAPPIPPLPKPTSHFDDNFAVETTATCTNGNPCPEITTSELSVPNFEVPPSIVPKHNVNMNISAKPLIIDESTSMTTDLSHMDTTNVFSREIMQSYYDNLSPVSSDSHAEDATRPVETPRAIFEQSLTHSAKNFFERITASSRQKTSVVTLSGELPDTNPFKNDVIGVKDRSCPVPVLPPKSPLRRPHVALNSHKKNPAVESQTRVIYEAAPIMYDNAKTTVDGSKIEGEVLLEVERDNVESWIQNGHQTSENYASARYGNLAPPLPLRNFPSSFGNGIREENAQSSKLFDDTFSDPTDCLTSSEWSEKVESLTNFRREDTSSQSFDDCRLKSNGELFDDKNIGRTNSHDEDATRRDNSNELWDFNAIQLTNDLVYLIKYDNEGCFVFEEFAELIGKAPDVIMRILEIRKFNVPFRVISRSDNSRLFEKLDRTSVRVPRDHNKKIGDSLNLVSLKSALKILEKVRITTREEIKRAVNENIFPTDSSVLWDVYTLIQAYGKIQKCCS